jgi:hypothetical protein
VGTPANEKGGIFENLSTMALPLNVVSDEIST